jgi:hypothetical protein
MSRKIAMMGSSVEFHLALIAEAKISSNSPRNNSRAFEIKKKEWLK